MKNVLCFMALSSCLILAGCRNPDEIDSRLFAQCQGESFRLDLLDTVKELPDSTVDAQMDQLRDWVWMSLLARISAQSSQPELLVGVSRQPVVRNDGLSHLLEQPVGRARSTVGKDGTLYVLVQRSDSDPARTLDDVLEAVDQESFFLGKGPKAVEVYGVDFHLETAEAQVCQLASVDKDWLEGPQSGFRMGRVKTTEDLDEFLDQGTDLLSASCSIDDEGEPVLDLTGRQRSRTARAPMTVAHVAALNREARYIPTADLLTEKQLPEEAREQAREAGEAIDSAWEYALVAGVTPEIGEDAATQKLVDRMLAWKRENPQVPGEELFLSYLAQGAGENLGFSLDPKTDLPQALRHLDELAAALPQGTRLIPRLREWGMSANEALALSEAIVDGRSLREIRSSVEGLRAALQGLDPHESEKLLLEAANFPFDPIFAQIVQQALRSAQYQSARYDGPLQGSEPAMTMFYTDLLAKLWALDWKQCSPTGIIPGFASVIDQRNSSAFCEEDQGAENTRLWFGPRQEAYARDRTTALRLSPNATRLFALGSELGSGFSEEVEASSYTQRFIRWWDRHYEDVADWEPQYELLNQLVKWTLVKRMADDSEVSGCLGFLENYDLGPPQRFDRWVASKSDLRWKGPVPLLDKPEASTESLPLFTSDSFELCNAQATLSGGVSLPTTRDFAELPIRQADPSPPLRRQNPVERAKPRAEGGWHYDSQKTPQGRIDNHTLLVSADGVRSEGQLISDIKVRDSSGFRPEAGPIKRGKEFVIGSEGNTAAVRESLDGFGVGRLKMSDLKSTALQISFQPGPQRFAERLALEVSQSLQTQGKDLKTAAQEVAGDVPLMILDDGRVALGPLPAEGGGRTYAILSSGGGVRGPPPPPEGPGLIVGAPEPGGGGGRKPGSSGHGHGGPEDGNSHLVRFVLLKDKDAEKYLRDHHAQAAPESDPIVREVNERLKQGDLAGARKTAEAAGAPPRALSAILVAAVRQNRIDVLESMTDRLLRHPEAVREIRRASKEIAVLRARLARGGQANENARRRLSACQLRLSIVVNRLPPRDAARELARLDGEPPSVSYVPLDFPTGAHLPSLSYVPGSQEHPEKKEVLELVDSMNRFADLPAQIQVGDFKLKRIQGPPRETSRISPWEGSSERLVSALAKPGSDHTWPLSIVVPCVDQRGGQAAKGPAQWLPDCERPTVGQPASPEIAARAWKTAEALFACDRNGDGELFGKTEQSCAEKVRQENEQVFRSVSL